MGPSCASLCQVCEVFERPYHKARRKWGPRSASLHRKVAAERGWAPAAAGKRGRVESGRGGTAGPLTLCGELVAEQALLHDLAAALLLVVGDRADLPDAARVEVLVSHQGLLLGSLVVPVR